MPHSLTHLAPAKLNLTLSVGPRDGNGLHPICSWMVTVGLHDVLTVTRLAPGRLSRYAILWHADARRPSDIDWSITDDLAVRAHAALERHTDRTLPVQLRLEKRIPVGGGLGGGSSDAAAMLRAVNELFDLGLSPDDLAQLGRTLGSDVPFLVRGGSAIVSGAGEAITPHGAVPDLSVVLVFPEFACATSAVYAAFDQQDGARLRAEAVHALAAPSRRPLEVERLFNDLTRAAAHVAPDLADALSGVTEVAQCPALLCGSGSGLFVICDDAPHAAALATSIESRLGLPAVAASAVGIDPPVAAARS